MFIGSVRNQRGPKSMSGCGAKSVVGELARNPGKQGSVVCEIHLSPHSDRVDIVSKKTLVHGTPHGRNQEPTRIDGERVTRSRRTVDGTHDLTKRFMIGDKGLAREFDHTERRADGVLDWVHAHQRISQILHESVDAGDEELLPGSNQVVDGRRGNSRAHRDLLHGHFCQWENPKQLKCAVDDRISPLCLVALPNSSGHH